MHCKASQRETRQLIAHFSLKERYAQIRLAQLNQRCREEQENHARLLALIRGLEQQILSFEGPGEMTYLALHERRRKQAVFRRQIQDVRAEAAESVITQQRIAEDISQTNNIITALKKKIIKIERYAEQ